MTHPQNRRLVGLLHLDGPEPQIRIDRGTLLPIELGRGPAGTAEGAASAPFERAEAEGLEAHDGAVVRAHAPAGGPLALEEVLAEEGTALAHMVDLTHRHRLSVRFPQAVWSEVEAIQRDPGLGAPDLEDRTALPFVTIDGPHTRDLDQAVFVEALTDGWRVHYALADASWYVRPGTALFEEALLRGSSYYLPGYAVPMLPRPLSEGLVSLSEGQLRRAVVFVMEVARDGTCRSSVVERARIRSRAKLTFGQVQRFLDEGVPLPSEALAPSMRALREVGEALLEAAERRDVLQFRRRETEVEIDGVGQLTFVDELGDRPLIERYNEQLSLACNIQGAELLRRHAKLDAALLQPIFRVHPAPTADRIDRLERQLRELVEAGLPADVWSWHRGNETLADYLERLPREGREGRLAQAIHRQAVLINVRSTFSVAPAAHFGVGADVYARFSAPMREIVGIFLHKEAMEALSGRGRPADEDEALRARVVARANESKVLQKQLTKEANLFVIDHLFERDRARAERPWHRGTVMGITRRKIHVGLDAPTIEVKVYTKALQSAHGELTRSTNGTALDGPDAPVCRLGDEVEVRVESRHPNGRWDLVLRRVGGP